MRRGKTGTLDDELMAAHLTDVIDVSRFKAALEKYMERTLRDLRATYPSEEFYWIGPYCGNDALGYLADSAAGRDAVKELVKTLENEHPWTTWSPSERIGAARWMCADLPYHCFGADRGYGAEVDELLEPWKDYLDNEKNDPDDVIDRIYDELRLAIDDALRSFKGNNRLNDLLVLFTGADLDWRWCVESAVRVNGEAFCRSRYPDVFEQY